MKRLNISNNPRHWSLEDVEQVKSFAMMNNGFGIFNGIENDEPTYCRIRDNRLHVWYYIGKIKSTWRFD